jgi:hypothetical protein
MGSSVWSGVLARRTGCPSPLERREGSRPWRHGTAVVGGKAPKGVAPLGRASFEALFRQSGLRSSKRGEPHDRLRGATDPQGVDAEKTVEVGRNGRDGTSAEDGSSAPKVDNLFGGRLPGVDARCFRRWRGDL